MRRHLVPRLRWNVNTSNNNFGLFGFDSLINNCLNLSNLNNLCENNYCNPCNEFGENQKYFTVPDSPSREFNKAFVAIKLTNNHYSKLSTSLAGGNKASNQHPYQSKPLSLASLACVDTGNLFSSCLDEAVAKKLKIQNPKYAFYHTRGLKLY